MDASVNDEIFLLKNDPWVILKLEEKMRWSFSSYPSFLKQSRGRPGMVVTLFVSASVTCEFLH